MTEQEKRIGSNMAYVNGVGILVNFAILALLIGPGSTGYDTTYGAITDLISLVASFAAACVVIIAGKLWDWENNFYFGLMTRIVFVIACVQMLTSVSGTATANAVFDTVAPGSAANAGKDSAASNRVMAAKTPAKMDEILFIRICRTLVNGFT